MRNNIKYTYSDISIVPEPVTEVRSRSDCHIYKGDSQLPLITAPMSSVISIKNFELFKRNGIAPVLPRNEDYEDRIEIAEMEFAAFSLTEFESLYKSEVLNKDKKYWICIDIANGHMKALHNAIREAKEKYPNLIIMSGNVASPEGYVALSDAGCDWVRIGIGAGGACITSSNSGVHYPMASLVRDCWEISQTLVNPALIVADGGIRGFSDITKALALGADYVMCGTIFNKMLESAGETRTTENTTDDEYDEQFVVVDQYSDLAKYNFKHGTLYHKIFYGMSTRRAQVEMGNTFTKTSEGIEKTQLVEYTMEQWIDNFSHYLKSVMSYTNRTHIEDLIGLPDSNFIIMSPNSIAAINK